jgi:hypothetical protein
MMRKSIATWVALVLALAIAPAAWAQGDKDKDKARGGSSAHSEAQTIHGVVAGVTAEGETVFDYKANRATTVEAAYLTVVGSPKMMDKDRSRDNDRAASGDKAASTDRKRENIYIVWLSPKTKVCECTDSSGKSEATKECSLDRLEVGDRVEVQFVRRDDSNSGTNVHNDKAKMKHGRHRTFIGDANSITIMPSKDDDHASSSKDSSKSGDKESSSRSK